MSYGIILTVQEKGKSHESSYIFHVDTKEQVDSLITDTLTNARTMGSSVNHVTVMNGSTIVLDENTYGNRASSLI